MSGVFNECDILLKCALLPAESAEPLEAVKKQLNAILFKFSEEVGGVPLMYSTLKFPKGKECGRIIGENYWVHVDVMTTLLLFQPVIGKPLSGKITKVSDNYVSVLVYGLFNASIAGTEMSKTYTFNSDIKAWQTDTHTVREGDEFTFKISNFQHANGVINIDGQCY